MTLWPEQYVVSLACCDTIELRTALQKIADAGFKSVELWANLTQLDPRINPNVQEARALLDDLGLQAWSIHTPYSGLHLGYPDAGLKKEWLRVVAKSLEIGAALGARIAIVHVNSDADDLVDETYEESRDLSMAFVRELNARAVDLGIVLALENLRIRPNVSKRFGWSLKELDEAFPEQAIGFCLDTGHAALNALDPCSEAEAVAGRLVTIHANGNDGVKDHHWLPTKGVVEWERLKATLARCGYRGRYVLETSKWIAPDGDPDEVIRMVAEFCKVDSRAQKTWMPSSMDGVKFSA